MPRNSGKEGFIAIIALAIFALIMLFGILVQTTVVNTFASVKNTDNYFKAKDLADSLTESMQFTLKSHLPGYSTGRVHCRYEPGAAPGNGGLTVDVAGDEVCAKVEAVGRTMGGHTIDVVYEIKGRPGDSEKISSARCPAAAGGANNGCFSTPMKDGDAGSRCSLYPLEALFNRLETVDSQIAGTAAFLVDHLDYPCNWNKLTFGSSLSDRVAVPLFYDDGHGVAVNPYIPTTPADHKATKFVLRLRTPCLPCGASLATGTRACGADPTVCRDDERYQLSVADGDEMVVQWQLDGRCTPLGGQEQECGLVGYPDAGIGSPLVHESGIYMSTIKNAVVNANNVIPNLTRKGQVTHLNGQLKRPMSQMLSTFTLPIFTLFLNHSLTSDTGSNIPYLEYQMLTDNPIGNSKTMLEAVVTVDGSSYTKTLFKEQSKPLIDFAIQN